MALRIQNAKDFGRVAVLLGGTSSERAVSLDSGRNCLEALQRRGVDAHEHPPERHATHEAHSDAGVLTERAQGPVEILRAVERGKLARVENDLACSHALHRSGGRAFGASGERERRGHDR